MLPLEKFIKSCNAADSFPKNVVPYETCEYILTDYFNRLDDREEVLFSPGDKASLILWEYNDDRHEFIEEEPRSLGSLQLQLDGTSNSDRQDPRCRFIFVLAEHSRARLDTSRQMLMYAFSYHQVMPIFLEFLFPFGQQTYTQDFYFSGFRHGTQLAGSNAGLNLPKLRRSGRSLRMCYSLKSVEKSTDQWPWSVRSMATYHSFDVEYGNALWISVKGNDLIQDRVMSATENIAPDSMPFSTKERAFQESLSMHLLNAKWSSEQWRWYLNALEDELHATSRRALSARVAGRRTENPHIREFIRTRTMTGKEASQNASNPSNLLQPPRLDHNRQGTRTRSISRESHLNIDAHDQFSFKDLQHVQSLQEKVNEVKFVLKANIDVLKELTVYYQELMISEDYVKELSTNHKRAVDHFEKQIVMIINDLQMQSARAETLVGLLVDRKQLLYGILEYRSMAASKSLAIKSQQSANNMEEMTKDMQKLTKEMHKLAQITKQETVSMRIITLVTLFFLPGTFISTIMSTDIVKFEGPIGGPASKIFRLDALKLYLSISIPMMVLTFATWGVLYKLESRKAAKEEQKVKECERNGAEKDFAQFQTEGCIPGREVGFTPALGK